MKRNFVVVSIIGLLVIGCASSNRGKTLEFGLGAAALGAAYGASRPDYKNENAVMYGSIAGAIALGLGLFIFDEHKRAEGFRTQALELQSRMDGNFSAASAFAQPRAPVAQGQAFFLEQELPDELRNLVQQGGWRFYDIHNWVRKGPNRIILESKLFEFIPPRLTPGGSSKPH